MTEQYSIFIAIGGNYKLLSNFIFFIQQKAKGRFNPQRPFEFYFLLNKNLTFYPKISSPSAINHQ